MLKFFIKVFRSLYLLNMLMDQVDTLLVDIGLKFYAVPSWSTLGDLEVKVTDFSRKFYVKNFH